MAIKFSSQNISGLYVSAVFKSTAAKIVAKIEKITKRKWGEVSLVFVTPQRIKYLNSVYHHHNQVTDVLSFIYKKDSPINGEIVICVKKAATQAKYFKRSLNKELKFLFIHGCLHLQGFDHTKADERKTMEQMEDRIYNK